MLVKSRFSDDSKLFTYFGTYFHWQRYSCFFLSNNYETKDKRSSSFLFQAISMEVQRGNCASVLGTVESPKLLQELFNLLDTKPDSHSA